MPGFFIKMFIGLLSFSGFLAIKWMSLNNEQGKTRLFLIDFNPVELKYCPFMLTFMINIMELVILLGTYLAEFVPQTKQKM